jgi:hypothetical protein
LNNQPSELKRPQSRNEETANSAAHSIGLLAALIIQDHAVMVPIIIRFNNCNCDRIKELQPLQQ